MLLPQHSFCKLGLASLKSKVTCVPNSSSWNVSCCPMPNVSGSPSCPKSEVVVRPHEVIMQPQIAGHMSVFRTPATELRSNSLCVPGS